MPTQRKIVLKNFPTLQKIKIHRHIARQSQQTMTRKLNIDKAYNDTVDRSPAGNSGFAKKRVQWLIEHSTSHQLLCYVDSFELRNPLLRKAAKRWEKSPFGTIFPIGLPLRGRCETIVAFARLSPITRFARFFFESKLSRKTSQSGSPLAETLEKQNAKRTEI